jgi:hypothetical protein
MAECNFPGVGWEGIVEVNLLPVTVDVESNSVTSFFVALLVKKQPFDSVRVLSKGTHRTEEVAVSEFPLVNIAWRNAIDNHLDLLHHNSCSLPSKGHIVEVLGTVIHIPSIFLLPEA